MKRLLLASVFASFSTLLFADLTVVQEFSSNDPSMAQGKQEMSIYVSKDRTRIEHANGGMIMMPGENKSVMLMHSQRAYMILPADQRPLDSGNGEAGGGETDSHLKWKKTGKTDKIAGYNAEQWIGTDADGKKQVEVWVGGKPEFIDEYIHSFTGKGGMGRLAEALKANRDAGPYKDGYPLKSITYDDDGNVVSTTTVKKIDNSPVDSKWFEIPSGYSELKMPGMGGPPGQPPMGDGVMGDPD